MVAKLVLALMALVIIIGIAVICAFWYFNQQSKRQHEKDLKQMEHTEDMVSIAEDETGIDNELDRKK